MDNKIRSCVARSFVILLVIGIWSVAGCSNVSQDNYDRLKIGMTYDDVISILGDADDCQNAVGMTSCIWGSEETYIQVRFMGKKVVFFNGDGL